MIAIDSLTVSYQGRTVPDDISLEVCSGECVLVTGPSGCGKSTLAKVICGLILDVIPAEISGQILVAGLDLGSETLEHISQQVVAIWLFFSTGSIRRVIPSVFGSAGGLISPTFI